MVLGRFYLEHRPYLMISSSIPQGGLNLIGMQTSFKGL